MEASLPTLRLRSIGTAAAIVCALVLAWMPLAARARITTISDAEFWRLVTQFSEPNGFFQAENFISNETEFQTVLPRLLDHPGTGGVYLGVGPDQNFTYIVNLRPTQAFIVDIRRQNLAQLLYYKALIEVSPTRGDFLSRLFARPKPDLRESSTVDAWMTALAAEAPDPDRADAVVRAAVDRLEHTHHFDLTDEDRSLIQHVADTFSEYGPDITYMPIRAQTQVNRAIGGGGLSLRFFNFASPFPTYADLMEETDGQGENRSYLSSEATYGVLRDMERANAIIPIVGDFAGPHAIKRVGQYVAARHTAITAIYTSNVEQYLFGNNVWRQYYDNVATLPLRDDSTFIRSYFPTGAVQIISQIPPPGASGDLTNPTPAPRRLVQSSTLLCPVKDLLKAVREGAIGAYYDVIQMSK
jgi:hypothetical protein